MKPAAFGDLAIRQTDLMFCGSPSADPKLIIEFLPEQWMELDRIKVVPGAKQEAALQGIPYK